MVDTVRIWLASLDIAGQSAALSVLQCLVTSNHEDTQADIVSAEYRCRFSGVWVPNMVCITCALSIKRLIGLPTVLQGVIDKKDAAFMAQRQQLEGAHKQLADAEAALERVQRELLLI